MCPRCVRAGLHVHPLSWVPPFTHYTRPSPAGAAGAPGLHVALQLPTACGVSRWCKIPRQVPQAHGGVGPHACSPCPPPSTAQEGCDAAGHLLAVAHQALDAAVSTPSKVSPPVTICCVSFPADPFFVSVSLKLPGYPLILLVAIFHFKWPAWGNTHRIDSSLYWIHTQCLHPQPGLCMYRCPGHSPVVAVQATTISFRTLRKKWICSQLCLIVLQEKVVTPIAVHTEAHEML